MLRTLLLSLSCFGLLFASEAMPALRLGVLANRGELTAKSQWSDFTAWVGSVAGRPAELVPLAIAQVPKAVGDKTVDLMICNPGLAARLIKEHASVPLATWKAKDGATCMAGVILANPKAGITTIADLRGKSVMTYGDNSAGAWQFQAGLLLSRGLDPAKDIRRTISKKQDDIVLAVRAGAFDAGFVRNGFLEDMIAKGKLAAGEVAVLEPQPTEAGFTTARTTPVYPEWFLLAKAGFDPAVAKAIGDACIALPATHPSLAKAEITGWVPPMDLASTLELLKQLKQPPFDR